MPRKKKEEAVEEVLEKAVEEVPEEVKAPKKAEKVNPKLVTESVRIGKDENGNGGSLVDGIVSEDGKSVTTLAGVTFAI